MKLNYASASTGCYEFKKLVAGDIFKKTDSKGSIRIQKIFMVLSKDTWVYSNQYDTIFNAVELESGKLCHIEDTQYCYCLNTILTIPVL